MPDVRLPAPEAAGNGGQMLSGMTKESLSTLLVHIPNIF
jgi:hypothetical protein